MEVYPLLVNLDEQPSRRASGLTSIGYLPMVSFGSAVDADTHVMLLDNDSSIYFIMKVTNRWAVDGRIAA